MPRPHPLDLGRQRRMIGRVKAGEPLGDLGAGRAPAPSRQIGRPSKSVSGQSPVVFCPG